MSGYLQLTLAQLRLFARNKQVLFWTLAFPIFFMVLFGSFLGGTDSVQFTAVMIDEDQSAESKQLQEALTAFPGFQADAGESLDPALEQLKEGEQQLVIVIPEGYGKVLREADTDNQAAAALKVYYDETNASVSMTALAAIRQIVDSIDKQLTNYQPHVVVQAEGVQSLNLKYIDFLVPGIVAMMIMNNNLNGVTGQIASWRERGILRRMQSTTLKASTFIAAQITARLLLNGAQAMIVLLAGALFFDTHVNGSWLLLISFVVAGTLAFMAIGFIIAGTAKTPESANPIAGFISFPMLFLGGVFFPIQNMPEWLQPAVKLLPISHLTTALRQVMNVGAGIADLWFEAVLLGGWLVVAFIIASFTFKWE